jgi:subtilisin family serine protease
MVPLATALVVMTGCILPSIALSSIALPSTALASGSPPSGMPTLAVTPPPSSPGPGNTVSAVAAPAGSSNRASSTASASTPVAGVPDLAAEWWLTALGTQQAWLSFPGKQGTRPGAGVTVAVLSTGVDATHPDLTANVITGPDYSDSGATSGGPFWGEEGTAVASMIAAHGHGPGGAEGITGIAPGARILSIRVTLEFDDPRNANNSIGSHLTSAIAAGISYAVSHGASVIALPLDPGTLGPLSAGDQSAAGGSAAEQAAVRAALADNVVLVAPAGDNAMSTAGANYPAAYPGVIAVGATDQAGQLEMFSSTRPYVALTAPGGDLTVAAPGGGYATIKTTDMSAALVAGVAALIRARYPRLSAAQVAQAIEQGTTRPPAGSTVPAGTGAGALNAASALRRAAAVAATLSSPAQLGSTGSAAAKPATGAAPPVANGARSGLAHSGLGAEAKSVLRDVAIGAGVLIVVLSSLLLLARSRRRRARAAREQRARAVRAIAARAAAGRAGYPLALPAAGRADSGRRGPGGIQAITGGAAARTADSWTATGSPGPGGLPPRPHPPYDDTPPWEPARRPARTGPIPALPAPTLPPEVSHGGEPGSGMPPWGQAPDPLEPGADAAGFPPPGRRTGPMYVWNPKTNSGPNPAIDRD